MKAGSGPGRRSRAPHTYRWRGPVPQFPEVDVEEAADALLRDNLKDRGVNRRTIRDLRAVVEEVLSRDPDPSEFGRLFFRQIVCPGFTDLSGLDLPFALSFGDCYFLGDFSLRGASVEELGVSGRIGGNLDLVQMRGTPSVSASELYADQIYLYETDLRSFTASAVRTGSITVAEASVAGVVAVDWASEVENILWLSHLEVGGDVRVTDDSRVRELLRIRDVSCQGDLRLSECQLAGGVQSEDSSCRDLDLSESLLGSTTDLRGVDFETLNTLGTRFSGRLLVGPDQLREDGHRLRSRWETPSRIEGDGSDDEEVLSDAADQLQNLREHFGSTPSMAEQEDYCAYRVKEVARRLEEGFVRSWVWYPFEKWALGYLRVVPRIFGTALLLILVFASLYGTVAGDQLLYVNPATEGATSVFLSGALAGWKYCFLFSLSTFATVSLSSVSAVGTAATLAAVEGTLGVLWMALFVVVLSGRIVRW